MGPSCRTTRCTTQFLHNWKQHTHTQRNGLSLHNKSGLKQAQGKGEALITFCSFKLSVTCVVSVFTTLKTEMKKRKIKKVAKWL